jgi:ribose/xylose/arabinose/galactoside ABC-type transport system permease subunit
MKRNPELAPLPFVFLFVFALMSFLTPSRFLRGENIQSMALQLPELGIFSLAMMITLLSGGLNLSVITTANLSSLVAALIFTHIYSPEMGGGAGAFIIVFAITATILTSLLLGLLNGFLIAIVGVSPILATLGTMTLYDGIAIAITKGYVLSDFPAGFQFFGTGTLGGVPFSILIFAVCAFFIALLLNRRPFGYATYMLGSNEKATKFSGINVRRMILKTYLISGLLSGVAAIVMSARFNSANAGYGSSYLLITVLIAVLGGVDPFGGFGKVSGLVMALVILQIISSGLNLLGVTAFVTLSLWGFILILVMGINRIVEKRRQWRISQDFKAC